MKRRTILKATSAAAVMASSGAQAQAWPNRPITMYVPFAAGGPSDMFGRILARGMSAELGQQVVVENKGGMGGVVGVAAIAKAAPDGYTIGMNATGPTAIAPFMVPNMPFEDKDLVLLTPIALVQMIVAVSSRLPVSSVPELIAYAKANPGKVNYGSSGPGGISHLAAELFRSAAGIDIVHVPYRGAAPAVQDLLAGQVQMVVLDVSVLLPHIRSGAIKAVGGDQQDPLGAAARRADHGRGRAAHGALGQLVRACRAGRRSQAHPRPHPCRGRRGAQDQGSGRADDGAGRRDPADDDGRVHRLRPAGAGEVGARGQGERRQDGVTAERDR